jgi:hypothetical protein
MTSAAKHAAVIGPATRCVVVFIVIIIVVFIVIITPA